MSKFLKLLFVAPFMLFGCETVGYRLDETCRIEAIKSDLLINHKSGVLVAAHRGHHVTHPENSLSSIRSAAEIGADIVEIDVLLSKDGIPVLMHDETLDRTTTGSGRIDEFTLAELKKLQLRTNDGEPTEERIPTLLEALKVAQGRIFIDVDLKSTDIQPIIETIRSKGMIDQVMFYNADLEVRDAILQLAPAAIVMPIAHEREDVDRILAIGNLQVLHLRETYNTPELASYLDQRRVAGWTNALGAADELARTAGAAEAFAPIIQNRPDVIQTDLPEELVNYLRSNEIHWSSGDTNCQ